MKPIPQVPAELVGLYIGAPVSVRDGSGILHGLVYSLQEPCATDGGPISVVAPDGSWSFEGAPYSDVALLLDSPLALCHAARWLAGRLGMDPGSTAPLWYRVADPDGDGCWFLKSYAECGEVHMHGFRIANTTDPAEALAAACVAVGGAG